MIEIRKNKRYPSEISFLVTPRDFLKNSVALPLETIKALNQADICLRNLSSGNYCLAVARGYINWNLWRRIKGFLAKIIFRLIFAESKNDIHVLFSPNGHDDGRSVDVMLFDIKSQKILSFLPWSNVFISQKTALHISRENEATINMLDTSMRLAGFTPHADPREKLQMHYRLTTR